MNDQSSSWNDQRMDLLIGDLLRVGVLLSSFVIAWGGLVYLRHQGTALPSYAVFKGEPTDLRTASGIIDAVRHWQGRGIIQLGVLILIATPVSASCVSALRVRSRTGLFVFLSSFTRASDTRAKHCGLFLAGVLKRARPLQEPALPRH